MLRDSSFPEGCLLESASSPDILTENLEDCFLAEIKGINYLEEKCQTVFSGRERGKR